MYIGVVFGYNITHTNLIDYDRISYAKTSLAHISKMVSIIIIIIIVVIVVIIFVM